MNEKKWLYDFRVAYKRLTNKYKKDPEEYFNSVVWLGKLSQFRKNQKEENNIDEVFEFIGGGALLINNGSLIAGKNDLLGIQKFDQTYTKKDKDGNEITIPPTGYNAVQLIGAIKRILIAKLNEIPFLLFVKESAIELQKLLSDNGFSDLICFDGGGAIYFATSQKVVEKIGNVSPSGFDVKVERKYEK